jgi:succinyl-CoA synthetase alpha subunit
MLQTIIRKGSYQDSVTLMLLTNRIDALEGVEKVSIMMATPANKDILAAGGLATDELRGAGANDMAIVMQLASEELAEVVLAEVEDFLNNQAVTAADPAKKQAAQSWEQALEALPDANLAVISIAGSYAAAEAERALDEGLHVFLFSDNIDIESERALKRRAHEKGLLVMGPDCGTSIISGVPIAFTNAVRPGRIGIVGASGTGIQEVSTIIDRLGEGVTNALGTGGRDLKAGVGGITMLDALDALEADPATEVIAVISKPPSREVRDLVVERLSRSSKPVVSLFLGERPEVHTEGFYHAYTLDEVAHIAVSLVRGEPIEPDGFIPSLPGGGTLGPGATVKAYYAGGTLASEAAMLIREAMGLDGEGTRAEGFMLRHGGNLVVDLGDDVYTQGRPHPMIAPERRIEFLEAAAGDPATGVILFDVVLGYGSHADMATALTPTIERLRARAAAEDRPLFFVATVCGAVGDPQGYERQRALLEDAGVVVCDSNKHAVVTALACLGYRFEEPVKELVPATGSGSKAAPGARDGRGPQGARDAQGVRGAQGAQGAQGARALEGREKVAALISAKPRVINIGLASFADAFEAADTPWLQFEWKPPAGGDLELIGALAFLRGYGRDAQGGQAGRGGQAVQGGQAAVDAANQAVIDKVVAASPLLLDVVRAGTVIEELEYGKTLLHAGPPIRWEDMTDPMQGSCVGAALFEGWAQSEDEARAQLSGGEVRFIPCHHVDAVGPMGGITSAHMPVLVVENATDGNRAYCSMNEGIGKVLRFGAFAPEVIERLSWMRDVLGPVLSKALAHFDGGLPVAPIIAKAIAMGDEFHQRNIAASLVFLKELCPVISGLDVPERDRRDVLGFLAATDQFFLNIMMASAKAVMDGARLVNEGSVVTAMCRNGKDFGIRISGMGDEWFTAPVNTPQGLYFTGYSGQDASPDMGDSAITETFGVGGMAMVAAPAVTRFVGAGGFGDARDTSERMREICIAQNPNFTIPTWDFRGICLGIDARKVVEKGITPVINTGIAHRVAGFGQIGAGTVHPPIECFEKAVLAYARRLGFVWQA